MAVTINAKGTSYSTFDIGKGGMSLDTVGLITPPAASNLQIGLSDNKGLVLHTTGGPCYITNTNSQDLHIDPTTGGGQYLYLVNNRWPTADGSSGQFLSTNGSGVMSWVTAPGTGTVTSVSVTSANGLAGSVATATTTPAITLSTTVTGVLKGDGTSISAASASDITTLVDGTYVNVTGDTMSGALTVNSTITTSTSLTTPQVTSTGNLSIGPGSSGAAGYTMTLSGGTGTGANNGGLVTIVGGQGGSSANGGSVVVQAGPGGSSGSSGTLQLLGGAAGGASNQAGGQISIQAGAGNGVGAGGNVSISSGTPGTGNANSGTISIATTVPTDGNGGNINLTASSGGGTNRNGGTLTLSSGAATGTGTAGNIVFKTGSTEYARINGTNGNLLVGVTSGGAFTVAGYKVIAQGGTTGSTYGMFANGNPAGYMTGTATYNQIGASSGQVLTLNTNSIDRVTIDSSGNVIFGGTSSTGTTTTIIPRSGSTTFQPSVQQLGATGGTSSILHARFTNDTSPPYIVGVKSRNATIGSHTAVTSGDGLLGIIANGSDGTSFTEAARISLEVDGTVTTDNIPGRIIFSTRPSSGGPAQSTERMRIDSLGQIGLGGPASTLWASTVTPIQFPTNLSVYDTTNGLSGLAFNAISQSGTYSSRIDGYSGLYRFNPVSGLHQWYTTTASSTAGQTVSFQGAVAIDANGYLIAGASNTQSGVQFEVYAAGTAGNAISAAVIGQSASGTIGTETKLHITAGSGTSRGCYISALNTGGAGNAHDLLFATNASTSTPVERGRFTSAGTFIAGASGTTDTTPGGAGNIQATRIHLSSITDASVSSTNHAFQIGPDSGANLLIDNNEIMTRNNGAVSTLYINNDGGDVVVTDTSATITLNGAVQMNNGLNIGAGQLITNGGAQFGALNGSNGYVGNVVGSASRTGYVAFYSANTNRQGYIGYSASTGATDTGTINFSMSNASYSGNVLITGVCRPVADNSSSLGASSFRWSVVYAATGTINTSDVNQKEQITDLSSAELATATALKGLIKKFKFKDAVALKGSAARWHIGVIAQEVETVFTNNGLDAHDYGLFCEDTWYEKMVDEAIPDPDNEGQEIIRQIKDVKDVPTDGYTEVTRLGVRYEELLAFIIAAM